MASWFTITSSVTLAPGKSVNIPFTLNIPQGAPPGGHFAVIWWNTAPVGSSTGSAAIVTRAGILAYVNVTGQVNESASILKFAPTGGGYFFNLIPSDFDVVLSNTGDDYIQPTGNILVKNMFGATDESFSVNASGGVQILPQSKKNLPVSIDFASGGFGFGIYHADLTLHYGGTNREIDDSTTFIVITWQSILPIALALCLAIFGIIWGIRRYNRWVIKKATAEK